MAFDPESGAVILFGGWDYSRAFGDTWAFDGTVWTNLDITGPDRRSGHAMAYAPTLGGTVVYGGGDGAGCATLTDTWLLKDGRWELLAEGGPECCEPALVWDETRAELYLLGGVPVHSEGTYRGEMRRWNGLGWELVLEGTPLDTPYVRAAYDTARGKVVFFGTYTGDGETGTTWEFDGDRWEERTAPVPYYWDYYSRGMAFDRARGVAVMYSGGLGVPWEWDGHRWANRGATGPRAIRVSGLVYDERRGVTVMFGGYGSGGEYLGELWEWDGAEWMYRDVSGPWPRDEQAMAYDRGRAVTVIFGGRDHYTHYYGDTWEWNGGAWRLAAEEGPSARAGSVMAFDEARGLCILYGGMSFDPATLAETWEWDGAAWSLRATEGPGMIQRPAMAYDPRFGSVLLHGGHAGSLFGDTWSWDGARWALLDLPGALPRTSASMAYDSARGEMVIFGGATLTRDDYWLQTADTWTLGPGPCCPPDCTADGLLNPDDLWCFQSRWRSRDPHADYDADGRFTVNDFVRFHAGFVEGCP